MKTGKLIGVSLLLIATLLGGNSQAARESRISATKHNLSSTGSGTTHSTTESQICVFCHTPHGSDASQAAPLWNKTLQNTTYTPYTSSSLDAASIQGASAGQPLGSSKLCLSCHDGVMALGSVRVLRGQLNSNTGAGGDTAGAGNLVIGGGTQVTMPAGSGSSTGYTRLLGTDLTNDHPISVTFDDTLSKRDGELREPTMTTGPSGQILNRWGTVVGARAQHESPSYKPLLPLEPTGTSNAGQVQCTTCHDPHIRETNASEGNIKFLRGNRFQKDQPTNNFSATNDIICLACHDKGMQGAGGNSWAYSVHANSNVATQTYKSAAATTRDFPKSGDPGVGVDLPVWKVACLNCHDTHSVSGSRRLLREGTDVSPVTALYLGGFKAGGSAALEETCYQCHTDTTNSILNSATNNPPNVKQDFQLTYRMRIRSTDQPAGGTETHDIGGSFNDTYNDCTNTTNKCGADLIESRTQLGNGNPNNRHVECSDCHNPHRIVKFQLFSGNAGDITGATPDASAAHKHTNTSGYTHTNVASGALRGGWGVEPGYTCCSFHTAATSYTVRRGDPGSDSVPNDSNADTKTYLTREYQVCLKCHSSFGFGSTPPNLDANNTKGLTPSGTNALTQYTDQAKEFQAPATHADESATFNMGADGGAVDANANAKNHRSWHPVMRATGRTATKRNITATSAFKTPWSNAVGTQTMYCSDCHGSSTAAGTVIPDTGKAWGPHGSGNPFILKGVWGTGMNESTTNLLCLKCHNPTSSSGFYDGSTGKGNLHSYHINRIGKINCVWCHVAVPHGWKNRSLLVNLNDVGEEAGHAAGSSKEVATNSNGSHYLKPPYYLYAKLKISSFATSGSWADTNCGSRGKTGANLITSTDGAAGSNTTGTGKNWMTSTCMNPSN